MTTSYTLILTKGVHLISAGDAKRILEAITNGDKIVEVDLDPFGGFEEDRKTIIATAHVICLSETELSESSDATLTDTKVSRLRPRTSR